MIFKKLVGNQIFKKVSTFSGVVWFFAGLVELPTTLGGYTVDAYHYLAKQLEAETPKKVESKSEEHKKNDNDKTEQPKKDESAKE